jgi:hypothetical protein
MPKIQLTADHFRWHFFVGIRVRRSRVCDQRFSFEGIRVVDCDHDQIRLDKVSFDNTHGKAPIERPFTFKTNALPNSQFAYQSKESSTATKIPRKTAFSQHFDTQQAVPAIAAARAVFDLSGHFWANRISGCCCQ